MIQNSTQPEVNLDAILKNADSAEADDLRSIWNLAGEVGDRPFEASAAAARVRANLVDFAARHPKRSVRRYSLVPAAWFAIAAALLIGAIAAMLWFRPVVSTSAPGMQLAVDLPDGSRAELNSGARLTRPRRFGDTRSVELIGEAYFDVSKNDKPFIVKTFNAEIRVLGTRFIVRSWPDSFDRRTTVTLEEGTVEISTDRSGDTVELHPGESRSVFEGAVGPVDSVQAAVAGAWR
ncbi:MAG: FecR family protein, partial [Rhodothermia bacterium]